LDWTGLEKGLGIFVGAHVRFGSNSEELKERVASPLSDAWQPESPAAECRAAGCEIAIRADMLMRRFMPYRLADREWSIIMPQLPN
jgi:hypothetical protein